MIVLELFARETPTIVFDVAFAPSSTVNDISGDPAGCEVRRVDTGEVVQAVATVTGPAQVQAVFAPGSLTAGQYEIQTWVVHAGVTRVLRMKSYTMVVR